MVGLGLTEFITRLRGNIFLEKFDLAFLEGLDVQFLSIKPTDTVSHEQLEWIQKMFSDRWKAVFDTKDDYTFNPGGSNECWVKFAHDLVADTGKTYLQILMPSITNTVDPNNFAKLSDSDDLRSFYIGADDKTLYSKKGLIEQFLLKHFLFTYNIHTDKDTKKYKPRSLSPGELLRIRSTSEGLPYELSGESYVSDWDYLKKKVIPGWHKRGEVPRPLLSTLLELVALYFKEKSGDATPEAFSSRLILLTKYLQDCFIDDANCLYGQLIQADDKSVFLIDILMDWIKGEHSNSHKQMIGLARWLCTYDASLIVSCLPLAGLYDELKVGTAFSLNILLEFLPKLHDRSHAEIHAKLGLLSRKLVGKTNIDPETISMLSDIYRVRWSNIQGQKDDYTRTQVGINGPWILLAQLLSGAGFLKQNYYCFLMPTLLADVDPVRLTPLTEFSLSDYVLSTKGKYLINLDNSVKCFKANGTLNNCNTSPPSPLSEIELSRVQYANRRYHKYVKLARISQEDAPPISRSTVLAIYHLVNNSLYPDGVQLARSYSDAEEEAAGKAYINFYKFLHTLPREEKERLLAQRIIFRGRNVSFKSVLHDVKTQCVAQCSRLFAVLVWDYAPYLTFNPKLNAKLVSDKIGENSKKRVFSDCLIDDSEAERRIKILAATLMSESFQFSVMGEVVSIGDCYNTMVPETKAIYQLIMPMISSGNFSDARFVYVKIMESVLPAAFAERDNSWMIWLTRSNVTQRWLKSIEDGSLFTEEHSWFKPETLIARLMRITHTDPGTRRLLATFLEDMQRIHVQPQQISLKEIRVNIHFRLFLNALETVHREQLLKVLETTSMDILDVSSTTRIIATLGTGGALSRPCSIETAEPPRLSDSILRSPTVTASLLHAAEALTPVSVTPVSGASSRAAIA